MKDKCKQKRYVCCHYKKDVNKLSKQDQEMKELLEEVRCVTDAIVQPGETFLSDIDIKIANLILKHTARAREEGRKEVEDDLLPIMKENQTKIDLLFTKLYNITKGSDSPEDDK